MPEIPPLILASEFERFLQRWQDAASDAEQQQWSALTGEQPALADQWRRAVIGSEFLARHCLQSPALLLQLVSDSQLAFQQPLVPEAMAPLLHSYLPASDEESTVESLDAGLRRARRDFMLRTIWRDLNRLASMQDTTAELSAFADACIQAALDFHYGQLSAKHGTPVGDESGDPQPMLVLGMGKLGACELNLSSDIDLIFAYPESGNTQSDRQPLSNQEFFSRLGQRLIKSLDTVTPEGFVFRVDMRLRPYGQSGALVTNFDSLENYYQTQGREWERYAMIKARVVAMSPSGHKAADELAALLHPFTYRRYLDYSAVESMRAMKQLITREVNRKGLQTDIKLGAGGIREVEFIVQVFQLIRGGRDPRLQQRQLLKVLPLLVEDKCLPEGVDRQLAQAYIFLRNTEHAIQSWQDRQTQQLPGDEKGLLRIAWIMGFDTIDAFEQQLEAHRQQVSVQFSALIADPEEGEDETGPRSHDWSLIWLGRIEGQPALDSLQQLGVAQPEQVLEQLAGLRNSRPVLTMQAAARERLDQLMPSLLDDLADTDNPDETLQRLCQVIAAVARRSAYLVLLVENPPARRQFTRLCSASPWIAKELAEHPVLLDELLDTRTLYSPPDRASLQDELRREVLRYHWDDLESHMESLRYFRLSHSLRVAVCEVTGILPLMKVSDYLTDLAEVILQQVLDLAWHQMVGRYGHPRRPDGEEGDPDFIIVGYGKLGGIELSHSSDLDLVFIHDGDINLSTDGPKEIDNATFFTRLGQKIIHILNTQTPSGQLYEVDMRLRPSGNSGLLVSSLSAFEKYQANDAWVWEHQALMRARVVAQMVAGSPGLARSFDDLRQRFLCQPRDTGELRREVIAMRDKMRKHLGTSRADQAHQFHLKQDAGGIVDIEFMVQYAVLAWAEKTPALTHYTDNIRVLGSLKEAGLLSADQADHLIDAYKLYRSTAHKLALQGLPGVVPADQYLAERRAVSAVWQALLTRPDGP